MLRRNLIAVLAAACLATQAVAESFPVKVEVEARTPGGELTPIWRFFGADEPNYATMKDGRALLAELGSLKKDDIYFRAHNLLSSGDGTPALKWGSSNAYSEDAAGNAVYDWRIVDGIFDAYLANGVRPFVQLGFMPQALSSAPASVPYKHSWRPGFDYNLISGGWAYPPRDYQRWSDLCFELTRHLVHRYDREEVLRWWFETWNEPNGPAYWKASAQDFYKLHDHAIAGVRRALPGARVGGPHLYDVATMGSPIAPDKPAWDTLRAAGQLAALQESSDIEVSSGRARVNFMLPRQAVSLLVFSPHR